MPALATRARVTHTVHVATTSTDAPIAGSRIVRGAWFSAAWLAVALGGIGVVVPGLPTTVFMIIAAACFARCSPRFEQWILDLPGIGRSVADYRSGLGMPLRAKIAAITMLVVAVSLSAGLVITNTPVRAAVVAVGLIGVWYIGVRVPTRQNDTLPLPEHPQ